MKQRYLRRIPIATLLAAVALALVLVPQLARPNVTSAQTQTAKPLDICGTVVSFTAPTATAPGSITFNTVSVNPTFVIAIGAAYAQPGTGSLCLVGTLNPAGQLVSFSLTPNINPTLTTCGVVAAFAPATTTQEGSIIIGSTVVVLARGTAFTGTGLTVGTNFCINLTLNGLGQVVAGVASANSTSQGSTGVPVAMCGTVAAYTAPTANTAGTVTLTVNSTNATFVLPAGTNVNTTISTSSTLCVSGVVNSSNQFVTVTFIAPNITATVTVCGILNNYTPASGTVAGAVTLGSTVIPVAPGAAFNGVLVASASTCLGITLNSLGQLQSAAVTINTPTTTSTPPTATVTLTPTISPPPPPATAVPTSTATTVPTSTATLTPVPTSTLVPTATSTPAPTATPTPKPKVVAQFSSITVKYGVVRIGTLEHLDLQAKGKTVQHLDVHVLFATGKHLDYSTRTDKKGHWSTDFRVPADTISRYSSQAVVTFQLLKNHTAARDYRFFFVIR